MAQTFYIMGSVLLHLSKANFTHVQDCPTALSKTARMVSLQPQTQAGHQALSPEWGFTRFLHTWTSAFQLRTEIPLLKFYCWYLPCLSFSWLLSPWLVHISATPREWEALWEGEHPCFLPHTSTQLPLFLKIRPCI